ncbi:MAG: ribonuclease H-like domain-containing protein [Candidatus Sumerlaeaceae bacterium]|nr:ribonuclease H-like domain-containing protein [Candidatus Sumerlaeaceae bacterium]
MSLLDKMDDAAKARAREARANIEKLLAQNTGKLLRASELREKAPVKPTAPLHELLHSCERITRKTGELLRVESVVDLSGGTHSRGYAFRPSPTAGIPASETLAAVLEILSGDELLRDVPLERLAFVDTETTGVMGMSGTHAFLIGLGFFRPVAGGHDFVCEQFFMEDYCHEEALLGHMAERFAQFDAFVTFNGKSYDLPLLRARCILNRLRANLDLPHLDLLHPSRAIFRARLRDCSLSNIEREVLDIQRQHDVEGALIPQIYFDYLRGRRADRLVPVFDHHAQDIISMGALLLRLGEMVTDADHPALAQAHDAASMGRLLRRRGRHDEATSHLERAVGASQDADCTNRALRELASVYKKQGRAAEAAEIWAAEWRRAGVRNPEACVELVKLYERHLKNPAAALEIIGEAERQMQQWHSMGRTQELADLQANLSKRRERLEKRVIRS